MTLVTVDLGDVAGGHHPDDYVTIRAEAFREAVGGGITSTAEVKIPLVDGVGQAEVEPGPVVVAFRCQAVADTREKRGVVPDEGPVGIEDVIGEAFEYLPPVVNRGLDQIEGARDEALAQVEGAVTHAIFETGGEVVRTMVGIVDTAQVPETAWAHATDAGHRLPLGYAPDGTLDSHAREAFAEQAMSTSRAQDDVFAHVMESDSGKLLLGVRRDGGITMPGLVPAPPREFTQNAAGEWIPVFSDPTVISIWGSSTPQRLTPFLTDTFYGLPTRINGMSKGGEWAQHTAARIGVIPARVKSFTIPPTTSPVEIDFDPFPPDDVDYAMLPYHATISGVPGTVDPSGDVAVFARDTPGSSVVVPEGTEILPTDGPQMRDHVTILSVGKNDLTTPDSTAVDRVIGITDQMVEYLTPLFPRFLIMGHHANTGWSADTGSRGRIGAVNDYQRQKYGPLFLDVQALYTAPDVWEKTGISPTAEDLSEVALGNKPPSLSRDGSHFNNAGHALIAEAIRDRFHQLGWY